MNTITNTNQPVFVVVVRDLTLANEDASHRLFLNHEGQPTRTASAYATFESQRGAMEALANFNTPFGEECGLASFDCASGKAAATQRCTPAQARAWIESQNAGFVYEKRTEAERPINFGVQRRTDSPYGMDTIDVVLGFGWCGQGELEISTASWKGNLQQTREFAEAILKACDCAETRLGAYEAEQTRVI